jgi:enamine deaminase RidA (YjgF/YER057c/UK114 family)
METRPRICRVPVAALCLICATQLLGRLRAEERPRFIEPRDVEGSSGAVVVPDVPLGHTAQFLPIDDQGKIVGAGSVPAQVEAILVQIDAAMQLAAPKEKPIIVKLHVVATDAGVADQVRQALARRFAGPEKAAVTYVTGKLRHPAALVAMDAVFALLPDSGARGVLTKAPKLPPAAAILAPGAKLYISGQAEKGKDLAEMTRKTMESLESTLKHADVDLKAVVQVKSFVGPFEAVADAEREIATFFHGKAPVPPLVFVEWTTSPSIEIELVASATGSQAPVGETVEFLTPPGMTASPVFSRVARMAAGPSIYISGLYGTSRNVGADETRELFGQLGRLLEQSGSDFRHLAKATYYVSTDEASKKLNDIRPELYDPRRPPAASKAPVTGTGRDGRTITLDMIAAPRLQ